MDEKTMYVAPDTKALDIGMGQTLCQSGNLPNKLNEASLFEEDFI